MFLFLAGIPYENFRFGLGFFTPLAVLTGMGAGWLAARRRGLMFRLALFAYIGAALAVMVVWQPRVLAPVLEIKTREQGQIKRLTAQLAPGETVWTLGMTGAINTYTLLRARDFWQVSAEEVRATAPAYLLLEPGSIETQWQAKMPHLVFQQLNDARALEPLGAADGWTLYRIR